MSCLATFARYGMPLLLMHGLEDTTLEAESTALIYEVRHTRHTRRARLCDCATVLHNPLQSTVHDSPLRSLPMLPRAYSPTQSLRYRGPNLVVQHVPSKRRFS